MDDPNNRGQRLIKGGPPASPSAEETCASTVGTSSQLRSPRRRPRPGGIDIERQRVAQLGVASAGSVAVLVAAILPMHIFIGLSIVLILWSSFILNLFQLFRSEFQEALEGRGFGQYLPEGMYDRLVNTSFHEMMTMGNFVRENRHFGLYLVPGITPEQIREHAEQLVPRHRDALLRPGIGNILGPGFMRFIIGDRGLAERRLASAPASQARVVPRRLELEEREDSASGLGDEELDSGSWGIDSASSPDEPSTSRSSIIALDPSLEIMQRDNSVVEEEEDNVSADEEVIQRAVAAGMANLRNMALSAAGNSISRAVLRTARMAFRATIGVGAITAGVGLVGFLTGHWTPQDFAELRSFRLPNQASMSRESAMLFSSAVGGGATAGLFMMFGPTSSRTENKKKAKNTGRKASPTRKKKA